MNIPSRTNKLVRALVISSSILALIAGVQATIIWTADFSDMSTGADGETNLTGAESNTHPSIINQMNANPSGSDLVWQSMKLGYSDHTAGGYRSSLSIDDDGVNQALHVSSAVQLSGGEASNNQYKGVMARFPSVVTLSNVGDYVEINFTGQFVDAPKDGSTTLRLGIAMDDSANLDSIYSNVGTGDTTNLSQSWTANNNLATFGGSGPVGGGVPSKLFEGDDQFIGLDPFEITLKVELIDAGKYKVTTIADAEGNPGSKKRVGEISNNEDRDFSAFDSFFIRSQGDTADFILDDVVITYVPEPSVPLMLGSLLCGTLLYRRRV